MGRSKSNETPNALPADRVKSHVLSGYKSAHAVRHNIDSVTLNCIECKAEVLHVRRRWFAEIASSVLGAIYYEPTVAKGRSVSIPNR